MPTGLRHLAGCTAAVLACAMALVLAGALSVSVAFADDMGAMSGMESTGSASSSSGEGGMSASSAKSTSSKKTDGTMHVSVDLERLVGTNSAGAGKRMDRKSMARVFPGMLDIETDPMSISVGKECSMKDLCGIDPCTCGKPDAWGHCACAGFGEVKPTVAITVDDEDVASVVEFAGRTWIVPHGAGSTVVTVRASLWHYKSATYRFALTVEPFAFIDALLMTAAFAIVVLAVLVVRFAGGWLARRVVRAARRFREHARVVAVLRRDHPATWRVKLAGSEGKHGRRRGVFRSRRPRPLLHEFCFALRDASVPVLAAVLVLTVLVPVSTTVVSSFSIFNIDYTHEQLKYQFFAQDLAYGVSAACVLLGMCLAFALYEFVLVRQAVTAHFSVGITRERVFAVRFGAGLLACLAAVALPFAISLGLNVVALGLYPGELAAFAYVVCGYALTAAVAFAISSAAVLLAGSRAEAVVFAVAGVFGVTVALWAAGTLLACLFPGCPWGVAAYNQSSSVEPSLLSSFASFNPILFFADAGADKQYFVALHPVYYPLPGNAFPLAAWAVGLVTLACAGIRLMGCRRGEQAEIAGMMPAASYVCAALCGLAAFTAVLRILVSSDTVVALIAGTIAFAVTGLALLLGPLRGKAPTRRVSCIVGAEVLVLAACVATVSLGFFGLADYQPSVEDVVSAEVSYVGSPAYISGEYQGVAHGGAYYATSSRTYSSTSSITCIEAAQCKLIADAKKPLGDGCVPTDVIIRYTRKDGATVTRYYGRASRAAFDKLVGLQDDAHARKLEAAVISADSKGLGNADAALVEASPLYAVYKTGDVALAAPDLSGAHKLNLYGSDRVALMTALAKDVRSMSSADRYDATAPIYAALMVSTSLEQDMGSFGYSFNDSITYVTDAYSHTLAWLRAHGYIQDDSDVSNGVGADWTSVVLVRDDASGIATPVSRYFMGYRSVDDDAFWYSGLGRVGATPSRAEVSDARLLMRIARAARAGCLMDGGYLMRATCADGSYTYLYLPAATLSGSFGRRIDGLFE